MANLEETASQIFWRVDRNFPERVITQLPPSKLEELSRYSVGKIIHNKMAWKARQILVAIGEPSLRYLFPALEHDSSNTILDAILEIAKKGGKGANTISRYAVLTLSNPISGEDARRIIMTRPSHSYYYLGKALQVEEGSLIATVAEEMFHALYHRDERSANRVQVELRRVINPDNNYNELARQRANQLLSALTASQ
jgi:hypothetical protein